MRLRGGVPGRIEITCSRCNWKGHVADDWGAVSCPKCMMFISFPRQEKAPAKPGSSTRAKSKANAERS